jgi:hypothetical protein
MHFDGRSKTFLHKKIFNYSMPDYFNEKNKKKYDRQEVEYMYKEHIENNIKNYLKLDFLNVKWFNPDDINIRDEKLNSDWSLKSNDEYVKESSIDKTILGKNILKNGTYWPFSLGYEYKKLNNLVVFEGNHRLMSIKFLKNEGIWPKDKKIFCTYINDIYYNIKFRRKVINLKNKINIVTPFSCVYNNKYNTKEGKKFVEKNFFKEDKIKFHDSNRVLVDIEVSTAGEVLFYCQVMQHWLRDLLWLEKKKNGKPIKASKILNDEDEWNKFIKEQEV